MKNKKSLMKVICSIVVIALILCSVYFLTTDSGNTQQANGANNANNTATKTDPNDNTIAVSDDVDTYLYNKEIVINKNAPSAQNFEVGTVKGYVEDNEQKLVSLPKTFTVKSGDSSVELVEITSIGKYTGMFIESEESIECKDALAIMVRNPSDKYISVASIKVKYDNDKDCVFTPTNIPPKCSAIVMSTEAPVNYSDVKMFECSLEFGVPQNDMNMIKDKVGVDYKDGTFIITNLTSEDIGDVYIRFKKFTEGNVFLGGKTYSVFTRDVKAHQTHIVDAIDYDENTCVIISVENHNL